MAQLKLIAAVCIAAPALLALSGSMVSAQQDAPAAEAPADATLVAGLSQEVTTEATKLPADTASIEDYEAAIMFAVNQRDYALEVILGALDIVERQPNLPNAERLAITNVRRSLANRRRGTGALSDGVGDAFSAPAIGIGGGTTDYTITQ